MPAERKVGLYFGGLFGFNVAMTVYRAIIRFKMLWVGNVEVKAYSAGIEQAKKKKLQKLEKKFDNGI